MSKTKDRVIEDLNTRKSDRKKRYWMLLVAVIAMFIGNHIFNHVHAWGGIAIILTAIVFMIYQLIKLFKYETEN